MSQITSISVHPEIQDGAPVFSGTRIPVEIFYDYLRIGVSVRDFLDEFPSVTPDQAFEVYDLARQSYSVDQLKAMVAPPDRFPYQSSPGSGRGSSVSTSFR